MLGSIQSAARIGAALVAGAVVVALPSLAGAVNLPRSINTPPRVAGTEQVTAPGRAAGYREGIEGGVGLGTGFSQPYGLGIAGRLGYTFDNGIYAGGDVQYFAGNTVNDQSAHATFVGGELGYEFFPSTHVEVRPYAFVGPAFITQVSANPLVVQSQTSFALQPGVVATYHFGQAFVGGDAHYMVTPAPNALAVMATAGLGF